MSAFGRIAAFSAALRASVAAIAHAGSALPPAASSTLLRARRALREIRTRKGYQTEHRYCPKQFRHFRLPRARRTKVAPVLQYNTALQAANIAKLPELLRKP